MGKTISKSSLKELGRNGVIDSSALEDFLGSCMRAASNTIEIPSNFSDLAVDPVFTCIVTDVSGSMTDCAKSVIESQPIMLDALRGSAVTRHNAHYVSQILFNATQKKLNGFELLSVEQGADKIVILNDKNYVPYGGTALYDTLHIVLQDMLAVLQDCYNEGLGPQMSVAVITDGEDNQSKVSASVVRKLVQELRRKRILLSSVVLGLFGKSDGLDEHKLEKIKNTIGFDQSLPCDKASPRDIRRKFIMASQSAVAFKKH